MHVKPQYVYGMLEGTSPDAFSYFIALYEAALRGGVDTTPWDARLAEARARYRTENCLRKTLDKKMHEEADTNGLLVEALADGVIDDHERKPILRAVSVERETLDGIEASVVGSGILPTEIREKARARRTV
jgi:hypothetical protein